MNFSSLLRASVIFWLLLTSIAQADAYNLPELGDGSSSIVSLQEEYQTGQSWLRAFRRQAPISTDPLTYTYLHELIQRLAFYSPLSEKYFSLIVIDSTAFNAFAVPGNIIGINTGLFKYAETEDQLASVIAHELAHLSQRHYARSIGRQKAQNLATMAAFLGSLLIMASSSGEAGIAALTATQAAAIDNQLKYSRLQEQEADRIGMNTMVNANMNPEALAHMFQHMLVATRYRTDIKQYDFLLTHPLAESRVSDAVNQAREYPRKSDQDNFVFHLIKARIAFLTETNPELAIKHFQDETKNTKFPKASKYGLALALMAAGQIEEAAPIIHSLYQDSPHQTAFLLAYIDLLTHQQKYAEATTIIQQHLAFTPKNYALNMKAATFFLKINQPAKAVSLLRILSASKFPDTPDVWYLLAEAEGLAGNIVEVHLSRAEYFERMGDLTQSQRHLNLALPMLTDNAQATAKVKIRLKEIEQLKQNQQF